MRFVLTTPLRPAGEIADHIHRHGDGMRDVALWVDDACRSWRETTDRGARSVCEPFEMKDEFGSVRMATIATYGDTVHTFVERSGYAGAFLPGYRAVDADPLARPVGLLHIDHMVGNVGWNKMDRWVDYYSDILGFSLYQHFDDNDISTEYSALMSKQRRCNTGQTHLAVRFQEKAVRFRTRFAGKKSYFIPNWANRKLYISAFSSIASSLLVLTPWPAFALVRSITGSPDAVAACNSAVILRECAGFTR